MLIFTGLQWLRLAGALADWAFLASLPLRVPVAYLALSGLVWGLVGTAILWGLALRRAWAPRATRLAFVVYALYYWLDRLWLAAKGPQNANWPFAFLITVIALAWVFPLFSLTGVRAYFGVKHERTKQN